MDHPLSPVPGAVADRGRRGGELFLGFLAGLPGLFVDYNDLRRDSDVFRGSWDYTFSPTVFNHFYGGGNNWKENHDPPQATVVSGTHWKDKVCIINVPDCDQNLVRFTF